MGRFQDATALFGEMPSYFTEQLVLKVQTPVFGAKYLGFKFFELWRDETFGIDQGLFAYEIVRHLVTERFADLEKIAKDFIITNSKFREAGGSRSFFSRLSISCRPSLSIPIKESSSGL